MSYRQLFYVIITHFIDMVQILCLNVNQIKKHGRHYRLHAMVQFLSTFPCIPTVKNPSSNTCIGDWLIYDMFL